MAPVARNFTSHLSPPDVVRRVMQAPMEHQQGQLEDDAHVAGGPVAPQDRQRQRLLP